MIFARHDTTVIGSMKINANSKKVNMFAEMAANSNAANSNRSMDKVVRAA